jgi:hypothetical protein
MKLLSMLYDCLYFTFIGTTPSVFSSRSMSTSVKRETFSMEKPANAFFNNGPFFVDYTPA